MVTTARRPRPDSDCVAAVDIARAGLAESADPADVGEHLGHEVEGDRIVSHFFECRRHGYLGWRWCVVVARAARQRRVTVNEVILLPGNDAVVAPTWLPYRERVRPGDVGPGDLLPAEVGDPRLVPGWLVGDEATEPLRDDAEVRSVADEIGFGRVRVLSVEGRDLAAQRWYDGEQGPDAAVSQGAPGKCRTCGFCVRLGGPLATLFGVCANEVAVDDGAVVSFDHGCGAHSQGAPRSEPARADAALPGPAFDTVGYDDFPSR